MKTTTTTGAAVGMTVRDAYEEGRYVTRHIVAAGGYRDQAVQDRIDAMTCERTPVSDALFSAYMLGRDKLARTGEP